MECGARIGGVEQRVEDVNRLINTIASMEGKAFFKDMGSGHNAYYWKRGTTHKTEVNYNENRSRPTNHKRSRAHSPQA